MIRNKVNNVSQYNRKRPCLPGESVVFWTEKPSREIVHVTRKFLVKASGLHPVTSEPFSWYAVDVLATEKSVLGVRYRLHPTESGTHYSLAEATAICQSITDKGMYEVEIIPARLN